MTRLDKLKGAYQPEAALNEALVPDSKIDHNGQAFLEAIFNGLYKLPVAFMFCHHQTTMHSKHETLNLYKELVDVVDDAIEKLIGHTGFKPYVLNIGTFGPYSESSIDYYLVSMKDVIDKLSVLAKMYGYAGIEDVAQSFDGFRARSNYLLSLKN